MYPVSSNHHLCFGTSPGTQFKSVHTNCASLCQFTIHGVACWESHDVCCDCCCRRGERGGFAPKRFVVWNEGPTTARIRAWRQSLQPRPAMVCPQPGTSSSFKPCQSLLRARARRWMDFCLAGAGGEGALARGAAPAWHTPCPSLGDTTGQRWHQRPRSSPTGPGVC